MSERASKQDRQKNQRPLGDVLVPDGVLVHGVVQDDALQGGQAFHDLLDLGRQHELARAVLLLDRAEQHPRLDLPKALHHRLPAKRHRRARTHTHTRKEKKGASPLFAE